MAALQKHLHFSNSPVVNQDLAKTPWTYMHDQLAMWDQSTNLSM